MMEPPVQRDYWSDPPPIWARALRRLQRRAALAATTTSSPQRFEGRFIDCCRDLKSPTVLELGAKQAEPPKSTLHLAWVPHAGRFIGTDVEAGPDVDVVADAHRLSEVFGEEEADVIIACSVLEHLKYPALAAHELLKTLKVGGFLFIQTHQTFPLHGYPRDYFRFSCDALGSLFSEAMGFDAVEVGHDFPALVYSYEDSAVQHMGAFLNTVLWGQKRRATPREFVYEL